MMTQSDLSRAAAVVREVDLTTFGRATGRSSRRTIWITTDALGRVHIRSGQGLSRDWPRNLLANPRAVLHINGRDIAVGRGTSRIVRSFERATPPSSRNMVGSCPPLNQTAR